VGEADGEAALSISGATVRYRRQGPPAVDGVSLSVRAGEVVAVLGPNGAGKSSLLRAAAGIARLEAGAIRLAGVPAEELDRRAWARRVAFVGQEEPPADGFTVREIVAMGRAPHQGAWLAASDADRVAVDDAIARCELRDLAEREVQTLSGGERRRVAVARALAQAARVLVLDEPAAFLDVRHQLALRELLVALAREDRVACLVAMHDLDAAARVATRVVLLRAGRVVAAGSPDEVMTAERLRETFDAVIDVLELGHVGGGGAGARAFVPRGGQSA
jgi:iron complex transport system ATP-binding protein